MVTDAGPREMEDRLSVDKAGHVDRPTRWIPLCLIGSEWRTTHEAKDIVSLLTQCGN
jgi:hypothetical protein